MRRQREGATTDQALAEARREARELAQTLGGASLSLAEITKELMAQRQTFQVTQDQIIPPLKSLVRSAEDSYSLVREKVDTLGRTMRSEMDKVREERVKAQHWQGRVLGAAALIACLLAGWVGWKVREWLAVKDLAQVQGQINELKVLRKDAEMLGEFMWEVHPKEAKRYEKSFEGWKQRNGTSH